MLSAFHSGHSHAVRCACKQVTPRRARLWTCSLTQTKPGRTTNTSTPRTRFIHSMISKSSLLFTTENTTTSPCVPLAGSLLPISSMPSSSMAKSFKPAFCNTSLTNPHSDDWRNIFPMTGEKLFRRLTDRCTVRRVDPYKKQKRDLHHKSE